MNAAERDKLAKVLGLFGSAYDGEIAAAARAAQQMIRGAGTTWPEVLGVEDVRVSKTTLGCCALRTSV